MPEPIPLVALPFVKDEPMFCFIDRTPEPVLWKHNEEITVGYHDDVPHPRVAAILKEAVDAWNSRLSATDSVLPPRLVLTGAKTAKVRIKFCPTSFQRFTGFANTAWIGSRCLTAEADRSTACLAIKGDSSDPTATERIYSLDHLYRSALHLLGHVLGLPHARRPPPHPGYKAEPLGEFSYQSIQWTTTRDASAFIKDFGYEGLPSPYSIMHHDVPAELSASGKEYRCGGSTIDDESVALLRRLYTLTGIYWSSFEQGDFGWSNGDRVRSETKTPPYPARIVSGISRIEFGTHDNIRVDAIPQHGGMGTPFEARIKTWGATHLAFCRALYLGIPRSKPQVETGDLWCGNITNGRFDRTITFSETYAKPVVMVSFNTLDFSNQNWLRIETRAEDVTSRGCRIIAETWAGSPAYGVNLCWLVHEADDPQIRSGRFVGWGDSRLNNPNWLRSLEGRSNFSVPMLRSPQHVWTGLCHANCRNGVNIRLEAEVPSKDQNGINWRLSTWHDESKWHGLDACYVAIL